MTKRGTGLPAIEIPEHQNLIISTTFSYICCMQLFYVPAITTATLHLPEEEARHAIQVLRKRTGDVLDIVDGRGGWFQATITAIDKRSCAIRVEQTRQEAYRAPSRLVMAVSPTKNNERFEWFLEKATEIGVDEIIPLQCARTERPRIRANRYEKVLVSAMKQSLQAWLPRLHPLTPFSAAVAATTAGAQKYLGWCDESVNTPLIHNYQPASDVCIFIGPEGDFTAAEVDLATTAGFQAVTLGPNRLRTETAALTATQMIAFLNQLKK